jgi:hypothetical protein
MGAGRLGQPVLPRRRLRPAVADPGTKRTRMRLLQVGLTKGVAMKGNWAWVILGGLVVLAYLQLNAGSQR